MESTCSWAKNAIAPAANVMPVITSGLAPMRGTRRVVAVVAVAMIAADIGRNARPDWIGEKPSVFCR